MPPPILVAGLDARSLLLEVPLLVREGHAVEARPTARTLLLDIVRTSARLVALGPDIPDLTIAETVRRIRASSLTRGVSVLVLLPASTSAGVAQTKYACYGEANTYISTLQIKSATKYKYLGESGSYKYHAGGKVLKFKSDPLVKWVGQAERRSGDRHRDQSERWPDGQLRFLTPSGNYGRWLSGPSWLSTSQPSRCPARWRAWRSCRSTCPDQG